MHPQWQPLARPRGWCPGLDEQRVAVVSLARSCAWSVCRSPSVHRESKELRLTKTWSSEAWPSKQDEAKNSEARARRRRSSRSPRRAGGSAKLGPLSLFPAINTSLIPHPSTSESLYSRQNTLYVQLLYALYTVYELGPPSEGSVCGEEGG